MHEDVAVILPLGDIEIELGLFVHVQVSLCSVHLLPMGVMPLGIVHLAEGLHGQEKHQLKGGYLAADGLAPQGFNKTLAMCHRLPLQISRSGRVRYEAIIPTEQRKASHFHKVFEKFRAFVFSSMRHGPEIRKGRFPRPPVRSPYTRRLRKERPTA